MVLREQTRIVIRTYLIVITTAQTLYDLHQGNQLHLTVIKKELTLLLILGEQTLFDFKSAQLTDNLRLGQKKRQNCNI